MSQASEQLPSGWVEVPLSSLVDADRGITYGIVQTGPEYPDGVPTVRGGDIKNFSIRISGLKRVNPRIENPYARTRLRGGEVLVAIRGTVGSTAVAAEDMAGMNISREVAMLPVLPGVLPQYLMYFLGSPQAASEIQSNIKGVAQAGINLSDLRNLLVRVPPVSEQRRIVAKIEELQARTRRAREALASVAQLLESFRQSVLAAALRGDLTAKWRIHSPDIEPASLLLQRIRAERRRQWEAVELGKMRATGKEPKSNGWKQRYEDPEPVDTSEMPELPEGWCWASLEELSSAVETICYGVVQPGSEIDDGVPLLRVCDIEEGQIRTDDLRSISHDVDRQYARSRLQGGEVVVTVVGTIGRVAVVPEALRGANIARAVARIVPLPQVQATWIGAALQTPRAQDWLAREAREVARKTLNIGTLARTAIPLAPLPEMQLIGSLVPQLLARGHSLEAAARVMLDRLDLQDQSILAKAFRGELVPQDPNDEPASVLLDRSRSQRERDGVRVARGRRPARPTAS